MRWIGEEVWARLPEQADRATAKSAASEREDAINHGKSSRERGRLARCAWGVAEDVRTSAIYSELFNKFR
jgi:hypothetical protein